MIHTVNIKVNKTIMYYSQLRNIHINAKMWPLKQDVHVQGRCFLWTKMTGQLVFFLRINICASINNTVCFIFLEIGEAERHCCFTLCTYSVIFWYCILTTFGLLPSRDSIKILDDISRNRLTALWSSLLALCVSSGKDGV